MRGEKVNTIHTTPSLPHRHECVCVRGQGIMFAFLPGVGTPPPPLACLPAESRGQARCAQWNPTNERGRGGRGGGGGLGVRRVGDCCIYLW